MEELPENLLELLLIGISGRAFTLLHKDGGNGEAWSCIINDNAVSFDITPLGYVQYINFLDEGAHLAEEEHWTCGKNGLWLEVCDANITLVGITADQIFCRDSKTFQSIVSALQLTLL